MDKFYVSNCDDFSLQITMDVQTTLSDSTSFDNVKLYKMAFIYNSLETGWTVRKKDKLYIFTKNHEGKKEVFSEEYLKRFMKDNFDIEKLLSIKES